MRKPWGVTALIAGLALLFSAGAMPAYADPGNGNGSANGNGTGNANGAGNANAGNGGAANAGGNGAGNGGTGSQAGAPAGANGTVKIHDWPEHKNSSDMANDPKVCQFEIHGFTFDAGQTGRWWIQEHKWGNGDPSKAVLTGSYTANASGDWTSGPHRLGDGHYKLFVEMTHAAGNSGNTVTTYKMKVFKVECPVSGGGTTTGGTTTGGTTTGGTTTGGTTTGGTTTGGTTTGGTTTGGTTTGGSTESTTTGGDTTGGSAAGTTTGGGDAVRTEVTTVVEGGQEVRVIRIFRNEVVVNEIRTPLGAVAGFESAPAGQSELAVAGSQTAPAALASLASLPSTSTSPDAALGLIGLVLTSLGAALLRRTESPS